MPYVQCRICGGTYDTIGRDGVPYFHACPPLSVVELAAAVAAGKVQLPAGETVDDAVLRRTYERAEKRDENDPRTRADDEKAAKRGQPRVVPAPPPLPAVVIVDA